MRDLNGLLQVIPFPNHANFDLKNAHQPYNNLFLRFVDCFCFSIFV